MANSFQFTPWPDTRDKTFLEWASAILWQNITEDLPYPREGQWKSWALKIVEDDLYADTELPDPNSFEDWREWGNWSNLTLSQ